MRPRAPTVRECLVQAKPLRSLSQEGVLALLLAAEVVRGRFADLIGLRADITLHQYNVLRILRGAGKAGLPTLAIAERTIERTPGVTRLLDRLEEAGWVTRERASGDRRQVLCRITKAGSKVLTDLDPAIDELDDALLAGLTAAETRSLIALLNRIRVGAA